jgi:superfamily II DNA/RNA helicase
VKNALIFCNRKRDVDILHRSLQKHGLHAAAMHGDMAQPKRVETLDRFKRGDVNLLVASDVAARGLDIVALSHVFNFDVPIHPEDYIHRIGRTGRAGLTGRAFTIASPDDGRFVAAIEKMLGKAIPRIAVDGLEPVEFLPDDGDGHRRRGGPSRRRDARPARPERREPRPAAERREPRPAAEAPVREPRPAAAKPAPRRERYHEEELDPPVAAFGDHMPDFLRRPVRLPKTSTLDKSA